MAEARDKLFPRPCADKVRYHDSQAAMRSRYTRANKTGLSLHVYECVDCGGWHLTKHAQPATAKDFT